MNKYECIGRVTKDMELKTSANGVSRVSFMVAVDGWKKQDGSKVTDFIPMLAFGRTAEVLAQYVKKGHRIGIVGKLRTGDYEKNGTKFYTTDVIVESFDFLEKKETNRDDGEIDDDNWHNDPIGFDLPF